MQIDVFQDTVCPWCRIGKANLLRALETYGGEGHVLRWRAYMLDPGVPEGGLPFLTTMKQKLGRQFTPKLMFDRVTEAGAAAGVHFNFDKVAYMPNTRLSHRLIALAPDERKTSLVDAIFRAYFEEGRHIGELKVLLDIAAEAGLDAAALSGRLEQGEGETEVEADVAAARRIGITGVPFFIINKKYALSGAQPSEAFLKVFRKAESLA